MNFNWNLKGAKVESDINDLFKVSRVLFLKNEYKPLNIFDGLDSVFSVSNLLKMGKLERNLFKNYILVKQRIE